MGPTDFLGYKTNNSQGIVLSIVQAGKEVAKLDEGQEGTIITNQTPFYGESGGQIGDTGFLFGSNSKFEVADTQKKIGDLHIHIGKLLKGSISTGDTLDLKIDSKRRTNIRAYHSATHLLHEALRRILGKHVMQKGSYVGPDKLRFDFSHMKIIEKKEIEKIEKFVNDMVQSKNEVRTRLMTPKEAVDEGALALFGEKYGDEVRVLSMGNEKNKYFSTELCGGTHVRNTSEIGEFKIVSQSAIASGIRRVEALRDEQLSNYLNKIKEKHETTTKATQDVIDNLLKNIKALNAKPVDIKDLTPSEQVKKLTKQIDQLNIKIILKDKNKNKIKDVSAKGIKIRYQLVTGFPSKELRSLIDQGKKDLGEGIVVAYSVVDNKIGIAVGVTSALTKKYNAVELVKLGSKLIGGTGGGGRPDFAQSGGNQVDFIEKSFEAIKKSIK